MLSKSVGLAAGQRVRLPSGLSPLAFVSLPVGHCVRLVSLLSPFVSLLVLVSLLVGHCVRVVSLLFPFSPNRFTCEGFLLLLKGCMLGPDDFEFVSGLVFLAA